MTTALPPPPRLSAHRAPSPAVALVPPAEPTPSARCLRAPARLPSCLHAPRHVARPFCRVQLGAPR